MGSLALRWRRAVAPSYWLELIFWKARLTYVAGDAGALDVVMTRVVVVVVMALAPMRADVAVMLVVKTRPIKQSDNHPPSS